VGPTCITALDDANKIRNFGFDGTFNSYYEDFLISTINNETPSNPAFWQISLNFQPIQVGGCQQKVKEGDQVLFAVVPNWNPPTPSLRLTGPRTAVTGRAFNVTVTVINDAGNAVPFQGAMVGGQTTNAQGIASVTLTTIGLQRLNATTTTPRTVKSNTLEILIKVAPPGLGPAQISDDHPGEE